MLSTKRFVARREKGLVHVSHCKSTLDMGNATMKHLHSSDFQDEKDTKESNSTTDLSAETSRIRRDAKIDMLSGNVALRPRIEKPGQDGKSTSVEYAGTAAFMKEIAQAFGAFATDLRDRLLNQQLPSETIEHMFDALQRRVQFIFDSAGEFDRTISDKVLNAIDAQCTYVKMHPIRERQLDNVIDVLQTIKDRACQALILPLAMKAISSKETGSQIV